MMSTAVVPRNWQIFLHIDANKDEQFTFTYLVQSFQNERKELVVTDGEAVLCLPRQVDESSLAPCSYEEADTRFMLHVTHAAKHEHDHCRIQVRTADTNVVVVAMSVAQALPCVMNFGLLVEWAKIIATSLPMK